MRQTRLWFGMLIILMAITIAGCGSNSLPSGLTSAVKTTNDLTGISIEIAGSFLSSNDIQELEVNILPGFSIKEVLLNSGIVELTTEGTSIQSIHGVTLDPTLRWSISINGDHVDAADWNTKLGNNDKLSIFIVSSESLKNNKDSNIVVVTVYGGRLQPELTHSYVRPYTDEVVIRDLLKQSGNVTLSDNSKEIKMVKGYIPKVNEKWVLKVNNKQLKVNGMDMKLQPQDEVQIELNNS